VNFGSIKKYLPHIAVAVISLIVAAISLRAMGRGVKFQLDFGNAMVGIGTAGLAFTTWRATNASNTAIREQQERQSKQKVSEFKLRWIEELRAHVAQFRSALNLALMQDAYWRGAMKHKNSERITEHNKIRSEKLAEAQFEYNYVYLMLDEKNEDHVILINSMKSEWKSTIKIISDEDKIEDYPIKSTDQARKIVKSEWGQIIST
jgi:biotin-(acetyl-CoA carboxylase) ligase